MGDSSGLITIDSAETVQHCPHPHPPSTSPFSLLGNVSLLPETQPASQELGQVRRLARLLLPRDDDDQDRAPPEGGLAGGRVLGH